MGVSAGGMHALKVLLSALPASFPLPIAIVQHIQEHSDGYLSEYLNRACSMSVKEADDKETLQPGTAYLAPAGYHLLIEPDKSFSLSVDEKVHYCRPSIDVLFESAADVYGKSLMGIILTGANTDGSHGLKCVKQKGGITIVQNPETAEASYMPKAAIEAVAPDYILNLEQIAPLMTKLCKGESYGTGTKG